MMLMNFKFYKSIIITKQYYQKITTGIRYLLLAARGHDVRKNAN